jgi:hypothetical protein
MMASAKKRESISLRTGAICSSKGIPYRFNELLGVF